MIGWSALSEHGAPWACLARRLSSKASGRYCDFKRSQNTLEELEGIESNGKLMTRCTRKPPGKISCSKQSTFSKECLRSRKFPPANDRPRFQVPLLMRRFHRSPQSTLGRNLNLFLRTYPQDFHRNSRQSRPRHRSSDHELQAILSWTRRSCRNHTPPSTPRLNHRLPVPPLLMSPSHPSHQG